MSNTVVKRVPCLLCGKFFDGVLPERHLKNKHRMTRDQYLTTFALKETDIDPGKKPESVYTNALALFSTEQERTQKLTEQVAAELMKSGEIARRITPEVEKQILAKYRAGIAAAAMSMIQVRLSMHGKAVQLLDEARAQLSQKWRLEQGGEGGAPTPIPHLVSMVHTALAEVKTSEELTIKTLKIMVDEQKNADTPANNFTTLDAEAYKTVPIPETLDSRQRENMRRLMTVWAKAIQAGGLGAPGELEARSAPTVELPSSSAEVSAPPFSGSVEAPVPVAPERVDDAADF